MIIVVILFVSILWQNWAADIFLNQFCGDCIQWLKIIIWKMIVLLINLYTVKIDWNGISIILLTDLFIFTKKNLFFFDKVTKHQKKSWYFWARILSTPKLIVFGTFLYIFMNHVRFEDPKKNKNKSRSDFFY